MSSIAIPTPFARARAAVHLVGLRRRRAAADVCDPAWRDRRHLAEDRRDGQRATLPGRIGQLGRTTPRHWSTATICIPLLDRGFLLATTPRRASEIYGRQRLAPDTAAFTASPWAYNGKIFALSEDGDTYVIQAGAEYKLLGRNSLGEMIMASPAIARGSLLMRTASALYRISHATARGSGPSP